MPEDITDTRIHVSSDAEHGVGQPAAEASPATQAVVGTTSAAVASTVPIKDHPSSDAKRDATPDVHSSPQAVVAEDAPVAPPAAGRAAAPSPLVQTQGKIALDDATLESLTQCILTGLRKAKAEGTNDWAEINSALKDIDDEKIGSCKEDIDTLLTFAGLFSAALTAFVVESYQSLSPDPTDQMIQLLAQIAVQTNGYTVSASHANATLTGPGTTPPPFEPSPSAILINQLWFASLVLALITTSFGILIKQWLREYKVVNPEHSNIRSRLRIRQFRYPGLSKWRVFEFAAFLPLLIQLALGLFLLGLCIFTWSINPSIGRTLTVLVAAWIFFLVAFAFAPVISARCPYKIPLLSRVYPALRSWLTSLWCLNWMYVGRRHPKPRLPWTELLVFIYTAELPLSEMLSYTWSRLTKLLSSLTKGHIREGETDFELRNLSWHDFRKENENPRPSPLEETDIAGDSSYKDPSMLTDVDDILLDDELLHNTLRTVIIKEQFPPGDIISFVRSILVHRCSQSVSSNGLVNVSPLSSRIEETVWTIVVHTLETQHVTTEAQIPPWVLDAIVVLVSVLWERPDDARNDYVLKFSSLVTGSPALSPGAFWNTSLQDGEKRLRRYFPGDHYLDPSIISRIHGARYCQPSCKHTSLAAQFRAHEWTSAEDRHVVLSLTKDALDESIKQKAASSNMQELLWAVLEPTRYDTLERRRLAWHVICILIDTSWLHVKSLVTSAHAQLLDTMAGFSVEDQPPSSLNTLNVDQLVSAGSITRLLRLLTFALFRYTMNQRRSFTKFDLPKALPELWFLQHSRTTSASSVWPQAEACSAELIAALYLLGDYAEGLQRWCTMRDAPEIRSKISAAGLWCHILDDITLHLPNMKPYTDRALVPMRLLATWHRSTLDSRLLPPQYSSRDLSFEEERRAKAAVAMVMQMFKSTSEDEPGPTSVAALDEWRSNDAAAVSMGIGDMLESGSVGVVKRVFNTVQRGLFRIGLACSSSPGTEGNNAEHELISRNSSSAEPNAGVV